MCPSVIWLVDPPVFSVTLSLVCSVVWSRPSVGFDTEAVDTAVGVPLNATILCEGAVSPGGVSTVTLVWNRLHCNLLRIDTIPEVSEITFLVGPVFQSVG